MTTYASLINANQGAVANKGKPAAGANDKAKALQYLAEHFAADGEFQVGKNRIFLRSTCHEKLQVSMGTAVKHTMCRFQALARKHIARKRFQHMRTLAIVLQAKIRMFLKRRKYQREMAATVAEKLQAKRTIEQRNQVRSLRACMHAMRASGTAMLRILQWNCVLHGLLSQCD
jgi:myosin heavy subunit